VAGQWFSPGTSVSSTNKTDRHNITEILLKVAFNTITLSLYKTTLSAMKKLPFLSLSLSLDNLLIFYYFSVYLA
jgi:hypothetical protein